MYLFMFCTALLKQNFKLMDVQNENRYQNNKKGNYIMKIAAIQLNVKFADVDYNLNKAEYYIKKAAYNGVELILLPEFFTSAIGFFPKMLDVAIQDNNVLNILSELSIKYDIIIGGSYLLYEENNVFNAFKLVFPSGEIFTHKKDIPTQFENCYYTKGDTDNILHTPIGDIGIALCWEMLRYDTIKRMSEKVDIILAGSCWWDLPDDAPKSRESLRRYNQKLALDTPVTFAKLMNIPVVHANHCGKITAYRFPKEEYLQTRQLVGATQIIDQNGNIIARRQFHENEGMVVADLNWQQSDRRIANVDNNKYWIPDLPESYLLAWEQINPKAESYYKNIALPYYKKHYSNS